MGVKTSAFFLLFIFGGANNSMKDIYFGRGVSYSTVDNVTIQPTAASGSTDLAGGNLSLYGGGATGNAKGGDVIFLTSNATTSGTTLQSFTERMRISSGSISITGSLLLSSSLYSSLGATASAATTTTIASISTGSYTAGFFDYTVASGSNSRAGTVMSVWNGASVQYTDNSTLDIGNTNDVTMSIALSGGNILLRSTTTAFQWIIKTTYRLI
jgi:hypothetical protein